MCLIFCPVFVDHYILLEIGALDKGDRLRNGEIPCVMLTEDTDTRYIKVLAEASGFIPEEFQTWSYNGCSNTHIALALNSFITDHAPGTIVVVHRDRDYMSEQDITSYKECLENVGIKVFITTRNDAESHFINEAHVAHLYPQVREERVRELLDQCLTELRDKILEKYINTIYNRVLQESYRGGPKPNAGTIAIECAQNFDQDRNLYLHGKIVESALRGKLQEELGHNIDLCRITGFISDESLASFANLIWREDE